ncbi:MAG: CbiX/SirB N-terminal domain-containing protein [Planctomycetaceae bacterium]|jgi:hypothetical protein|nr:CbiX/SirB N-terminal domain-containing protein [Planctomycetaceae bacterium]
MRKLQFRFVTPAIFAVLSLGLFTATFAGEPSVHHGKPGLLILSHGAPSPRWQESLKKLEENVSSLNEKEKTFHAVTAVNMEFARPDTADGVETLEKAGCDRIIVVPAFICPTSHTHFDVPAALGIYVSPATRRTMKAENARPAAPRVPVTLTQTIGQGNLLEKYVRDEIAAISVNPEEEAVLLISHGDEGHAGLIDRIMKKLLKAALESKNIAEGEYAYCGVGQSYKENVVPAIQKLAEKKKRVLIVGFYLVSSAKTIDQAGSRMRSFRRNRQSESSEKPAENKSSLDGLDVRFSERGVITHADMPAWVLQTATEALPE